MHSHISRMLRVVGAALSVVGMTMVSVSCGGATSTTSTAPPSSRPPAAPGTQLWVQRYNGPANGDDAGKHGAV